MGSDLLLDGFPRNKCSKLLMEITEAGGKMNGECWLSCVLERNGMESSARGVPLFAEPFWQSTQATAPTM